MNLTVSTVIPTHDRPDMLREAIRSVLAQTYPVMEIIVVDNGPSEKTAAVIDEFKDQVIYIRSSARGPSSSRNRGIAAARGRYVAFLDDDDLWHPEKLAVQMEFLGDHPDIAMVSCRVVPVNSPIQIRKKPWISGDLYGRLFMESFVATPSVVIRKDVFDAVGVFDGRYDRAEDYDLWLRIADAFPIAHLKAPLVWFRKSHNRLSKDKIDLRKNALSVLGERYNPDKISRRSFNRRTADLLVYLGREMVREGEVKEGRRRYIDAFKLAPTHLRPIRYLIGSVFK